MLWNDLRIDKLTGIFNRRAFDYDLDILQCESSYSMVFIDIDNFKKFNDRYGHKIGDEVLIRAAKEIQLNLRNSDKVYRYGGEEFVAVLKDCDKQNALDISEKIRNGVEHIDNKPYALISVSLGISSYPEDGNNARVIIENCDKALLQAKNLGKNRTELYKKTAE